MSKESLRPNKIEILVAEDSPTQAERLKYILEQNDYGVSVAQNGREALELISRRIPTLVISDIVMPEMDGYQFCQQLKSDENFKDIPIIFLTSISEPKDIIRGLEAGADNFIMKPYDDKYLLSRVDSILTNLKLQKSKKSQIGLEIIFAGQRYTIKSEPLQILNFLLSTYEIALQLNEDLEEKVKERTAELMAEINERKLVEEALRAKGEEVTAMSQQLWQAAKLATMGELAASIAHELNNPLAIVSLRVESMLTQLSADDPKRKTVEIVDQEVERMKNLIANLLQFSRRSHKQISTLDICKEIENTLELIRYHLRNHDIAIVKEFAPEVPMVHADRQQLRQLFLNLFTNASDAMPKGGTLTIRVAVWEPGRVEETSIPTPLHGHTSAQVVIEVSDTGVGIPPENLPRILEPFFTTKSEGKGTGLGLPICQRIVEEHHGRIDISSQVGKGTTVRIALPVINEKA